MRIVTTALIVAGFALAPITSQAKIHVFACEPEWKALAQEIGGDKVDAFSATTAQQDPHHIRARPSLISQARKTDLFFCSGAGLEIGWLPLLIQKAGDHVQPGQPGYFMAAPYVNILEKPIRVDRSLGDIHPDGNPHLHLNPYNILKIAEELTQRLGKIDPTHKVFYQARLSKFSTEWKKAIRKWEQEAKALKGATVIVHHMSLSYLLNWLGMKQVGALEPKPGIPPTTSHLKSLLKQMNDMPADIILTAVYDNQKASRWLAKKTNIPTVTLPYTVGGDKKSKDLYTLFDHTIYLLKETHGKQRAH